MQWQWNTDFKFLVFMVSCFSKFIYQIAPNQIITYVPALKPAPAFTWL
jgi:hypothetical protein